MFGPVPEYSVSQLARPVGALAGIFEEVGKIMVEAGAQGLEAVEGAGDVIREKVGMEREPLSKRSAKYYRGEVAKIAGVTPEQMKPQTFEAIKHFTKGVEEDTDKSIVENAFNEAGALIGGLSTFVLRDLVPILPTSARTVEQQVEQSRKAGGEFAAGPAIAAGYLGTLAKSAATGDTATVSQLIRTRPVTFALTVLPFIKGAAGKMFDPAVKAWVEKTAGKYYAEHGAPGVLRQRFAKLKRVADDPMRQATEAQTAIAEEALAEARAKEVSAKAAVEKAKERAVEGQVIEGELATEPMESPAGPGAMEAEVSVKGETPFKAGEFPTERAPAKAGMTEADIATSVEKGKAGIERGVEAGVETRAALAEQAKLSPEAQGGFAVAETVLDQTFKGERPGTGIGALEPTEVVLGRRPTAAEVVVVDGKATVNPKGVMTAELASEVFDSQKRLDLAVSKLRRSKTEPSQRFSPGELAEITRDIEVVTGKTVVEAAVPEMLETYALERSRAVQKLIPPEAASIVNEAVIALEHTLTERITPKLTVASDVAPLKIPKEVRQGVQVAVVDALLDHQRYYVYSAEGFNAVAAALAKKIGTTIKQATVDRPQFIAKVALEQAKEVIGSYAHNLSLRNTLRENGIYKGRPIRGKEAFDGSARSLLDALLERDSKGLPPPSLIEASADVVQTVINELQKSEIPRHQQLGSYLQQYVNASKQMPGRGLNAFRQSKIVQGTTFIDKGLYEAFEPIIKGVNRMSGYDKMFGEWKGAVTARNLKSGMNNYNANVLLEAIDYGNPAVLMSAGARGAIAAAKSIPGLGQLLQLFSKVAGKMVNFDKVMKSSYTRFAKNLPENGAEARIFKALRETGIEDTSLIDLELSVMGKDTFTKVAEAGERRLGQGKSTAVSKAVKKVAQDQDNFYKFGDGYFKFRTAYIETVRITKLISQLGEGKSISIRISPNLIADIKKVGANFEYKVRGVGKTKTGVLTPDEVPQMAAKAGKTVADAKYVDYGRRPLMINKLEELRQGPFGGPLVAPFLTWKYKVMDIPFLKKGVVGALSSDPVIGTTDAGVMVQIQGQAAAKLARRAALLESANSVMDDKDPLMRRALTYKQKGISPVDYYLHSGMKNVVFAKDFGSLNFFAPTQEAFESLLAVAAMAGEGAFANESARRVPAWLKLNKGGAFTKEAKKIYRDIANGQLDKSAILKLGGYGGSQISNAIEQGTIAMESGKASDIAKTILPLTLVPIIGQTNYDIVRELGLPLLSRLDPSATSMDDAIKKHKSINALSTRMYAFSPRNTKTEDFTHNVIRSVLGLGYRSVFMNSKMRARYPTGKLTKLFKSYQTSLYFGLIHDFKKKFAEAKADGATLDELKELKAKHKHVIDIYNKEARRISDEIKRITKTHTPSKFRR
jgi:hypothetical protein